MQKNKTFFLKFFRSEPGTLPGARKWFRLLFLVSLAALLFMNHANAQTIIVTGQITDQTGQPLPGVNIAVKGSLSGTTTVADGRYTLIGTPPNSVLSFSFIGFKTQEIPVNGQKQIDVQLQEDITALSEVTVNAGYYAVKERERTGSIAKITAKEIEDQPVSNVLSSVQGRMAGVSITQNSGVPGGGYNIQIRGINSLRAEGNYPMYIVDGVPVAANAGSVLSGVTFPSNGEINPLNAINPNDIESIEILKDADATAIYGSRGANGVILVTTKKGKAGGKTAFSVNSSYGISRVTNRMEMMNTEQYLDMRRQGYANDGKTSYPAKAYDVNGVWSQDRYTNWQEELIGNTAENKTLQLSISGGNPQTSFLVSGSHNEQTTVFGKDFRYKTDNLSASLNHRSVDNKFTLDATGLFSDQSNNLVQTDITKQSLLLSPNAPALYKADGSLNWENNTFTNPVAAYNSTYSYGSKTFNINLNLRYELLPSLYVKLNGGISYQAFEDLLLYPSTMYNPSYGITPASSTAYKSQNQRYSYLLEPQLNYKYRVGDHEIDLLVGSTYQRTKNTEMRVLGSWFESNALITNLSAANNIWVDSDVLTAYKYAALFGRINYQYKNRYIINLTGRRDGSSRFGPDKRFASFGAVGAAWLFSEESFIKEQWSFLSSGKLRGSYGVTGSDLIGDYQYLDTYTVSSTGYGGSTSLYPSRLYNPSFSWEKTSKLEVALELSFLKNRITFNAAWYRNRSGNQLVGIPLPGTTGFSSIQANLPATVENTGLEFELNAAPVKTESFQWNSSINISFPKNKLVSFPGLEGSTYANQYVVGYPTSIVKVYNYAGIDPATGLYKFTDYNNDGNITSPEDNQVIKNIGVQFFGGWSNRFAYKNLEFSFLFQFVSQNQWNYNKLTPTPGTKYNQPVEVLNVWSATNPDGQYMPYSSGANSQKGLRHGYLMNSTRAISDASFIRLKNVQLGYRLPVKKYIQDIRVYVQGQNLWTITNYFGIDPEFVTIGFLPPLKTWSLGVQLNF